jgi:SAM-dependent methyltransferase
VRRTVLNFVRGMVGLNQVNARFDAIEGRLGQLTYEVAERQRMLEAHVANIASQLRNQAGLASLRSEPTRSLPTADVDAIVAVLASRLPTADEREVDRDKIIHQVNYTNHNLYLHLKEAMRVRELYYRDTMSALDRITEIYPKAAMSFVAEKPVAIDTDDHQKPWGAAHDNTRSPRFVAACERHFQRSLTFLDLGCSGGGLVLDFLLRGHRAYGIEGSDHPLNAQRAEWRVLRNNLFTADITRPFRLAETQGGPPVASDVISMWEVLEHIADEDLPQLFTNITAHLKPDGIFIGSIALGPDDHGGASYHRTVKPRDWWERRFAELGLPMLANHGFAFEDFCRGTSNGPIDGNYRDEPHVGFHFVAARKANSTHEHTNGRASTPATNSESGLSSLHRLKVPLFLDEDGNGCLTLDRGTLMHKVGSARVGCGGLCHCGG